MEHTDLQIWMDYVAERYLFDEKTYPELKGKTEEEILAFAIRHSALHMMKSAGKVATYSEALDHGSQADIELVQEGTVKMLVNVLKLAELQGMTAARLLALVPDYMASK